MTTTEQTASSWHSTPSFRVEMAVGGILPIKAKEKYTSRKSGSTPGFEREEAKRGGAATHACYRRGLESTLYLGGTYLITFSNEQPEVKQCRERCRRARAPLDVRWSKSLAVDRRQFGKRCKAQNHTQISVLMCISYIQYCAER